MFLGSFVKAASHIFPKWITVGQHHDLLQISHETSPDICAQVIHYVGEYRRRVPQGPFKENDDVSAIIKTIVDLEKSNIPSSRETQLQSSSQDSFEECEDSQQSSTRRTSQSVLYSEFVKEEFLRLLRRSKERSDAAFLNCVDNDRTRHRNWLSSINSDSGAWLAAVYPKMFEMSNTEFVSAICRRNTVEDTTIPRYTAFISRENPQMFHCGCDGGSRPKVIDPYGYHLVGCKIGANAIRLHDEMVTMVANLFRTIRVDAIVEPIRLFNNTTEDDSNQRPDILLRNPRGFGRQVILDIAVTGIDGQSRTNDEAADRPLQVRYDQKMTKYGRVAKQNNLRFIPAVFSHTGQIHGEFKRFVKEQIRYRIIDLEGEATSSKIRSVMKWWSRCISMVIAKTASRNVAFKVAKMRRSIMEVQDNLIIGNSQRLEEDLEPIDNTVMEDLGYNADLYIFEQEDNMCN